MAPRVHLTVPVPVEVRDALAAEFELVDALAGVEGVVTVPGVRVDDAFLDEAGETLRVVANYAVGLDNVDLDAARRHGVTVTNTPDVLTRATAELAVAILLALLRRVAEGDRLVRSRAPWRFSLEFMLGSGIAGKTVLVVGAGRIGRETGRMLEALGAEVVLAGRGTPLDDLLAEADVVTIHCPLRPDTRHLFDAGRLARMKPTAVLVNTARGPIVDERALVEAVRSGQIAGAALDVYEREPEVEAGLLELENVVLTPHLGSATRETRVAMGMLCVEGLRAVLLERRVPANAVVVP